jgi:hypothetical protein
MDSSGILRLNPFIVGFLLVLSFFPWWIFYRLHNGRKPIFPAHP